MALPRPESASRPVMEAAHEVLWISGHACVNMTAVILSLPPAIFAAAMSASGTSSGDDA